MSLSCVSIVSSWYQVKGGREKRLGAQHEHKQQIRRVSRLSMAVPTECKRTHRPHSIRSHNASDCRLPIVPYEVARSSQVRVLIGLDTLEILFLNQLIDRLLDIRDFRREARFDLVDGFLHELHVLHLLAGLHDADDGRLRMDVSFDPTKGDRVRGDRRY